MTDLQKFLETYKSFGIEAIVNQIKRGEAEYQSITLIDAFADDTDGVDGNPELTTHPSMLGYTRSSGVEIHFSLDGEYISHFFGEFGNAVIDSNVESVVDQMRNRVEDGFLKYGQTTDRTDLSVIDWLKHAQEESMDISIYLEKIISLLKPLDDAPRKLSVDELSAFLEQTNIDKKGGDS